jgi:valyl-tRNA synthetase
MSRRRLETNKLSDSTRKVYLSSYYTLRSDIKWKKFVKFVAKSRNWQPQDSVAELVRWVNKKSDKTISRDIIHGAKECIYRKLD